MVAALAAIVLAACGGDDAADAPRSTAASTTATTPSSATTRAPAPSGSITTAARSGEDAEIEAVFVAFFDGLNPDVASRAAKLEHGDVLASMLADAAADPQFAQMSTQVRSVTRLADAACTGAGVVAPCAEVVNDLLVGQFPAVPSKTSYAVKVDGAWKVSAKTWCEIVTIGGASCPPL